MRKILHVTSCCLLVVGLLLAARGAKANPVDIHPMPKGSYPEETNDQQSDYYKRQANNKDVFIGGGIVVIIIIGSVIAIVLMKRKKTRL